MLITGANRGIGRAVARLCAQDKVHLDLVVREFSQELEDEMLGAGAASCKQWIVDLSQASQVQEFIVETSDLHIDVLFNNAGLMTSGYLEDQNMDDIYRLFQVNVLSLIQITHAFLPRMLKKQRGKIINHSSVSALAHFPSISTYAAAKAAVWALTDCLRMELRGSGVTTLNLLTPNVNTGVYSQAEDVYGKHFSGKNLAGRYFAGAQKPLSPQQYAEMIREAILLDLTDLEPRGFVGMGLKISRYLPAFFDLAVSRTFKR